MLAVVITAAVLFAARIVGNAVTIDIFAARARMGARDVCTLEQIGALATVAIIALPVVAFALVAFALVAVADDVAKIHGVIVVAIVRFVLVLVFLGMK